MEFVTILLNFALLLGSFTTTCQISINKEEKYVFSVVLFRHGSRSPFFPIPGDLNPSYWANGTAMLTWRGKGESYALGTTLRELYVGKDKLIEAPLKLSNIYCRSTDFDRTIMTAQLVLAAMFEPQENQDWNPELKWQPIPVHTNDMEHDDLLLGFQMNSCNRLTDLIMEMNRSHEYYSLESKYSDFVKELSNKTGNIMNISDAANLYDSLVCQKYEKLSIPPLYDEKTMETLEKLFSDYWQFHTRVNNSDFKRLASGVLWSLILDKMTDLTTKIESGETLDEGYIRLMLLSAHDATILHFLNLLGLSQNTWPSFNANLRLELFNVSNKTFMKVVYDINNKATVLRFPFCDSSDLCEFNKIFNELGGLRSIDRKAECQEGSIPVTTTPAFSPSPIRSTTPSPTPSPSPIPDSHHTQRVFIWIFILVNSVALCCLIIYLHKFIRTRVSLAYTPLE